VNAHRLFMLVGQSSPESLVPANDATREESECVEDVTPSAAMAALTARWLAEHWLAIIIGGVAGMLGLAIPALLVARLLS
jgi:hypothetical protein